MGGFVLALKHPGQQQRRGNGEPDADHDHRVHGSQRAFCNYKGRAPDGRAVEQADIGPGFSAGGQLVHLRNYTIIGNDRVIDFKNLDLTISKDTSKIAEICGTVLLANDISTALRISDFTLSNPYCDIETKDGSLTILGCAIEISRILRKEVPEITLTPNPGKDEIEMNIKFSGPGQLEIKIFSTLGNLVYSEFMNKTSLIGQHTISLNNFANGLYFCYIFAGGEIQFKGTFLVSK